jgi:LPXTG-motif cell wall-anchored protein
MYNLPHTGIGAALLAVVALAMKAGGWLLVRLSRRR